jgi:hypothetical protein
MYLFYIVRRIYYFGPAKRQSKQRPINDIVAAARCCAELGQSAVISDIIPFYRHTYTWCRYKYYIIYCTLWTRWDTVAVGAVFRMESEQSRDDPWKIKKIRRLFSSHCIYTRYLYTCAHNIITVVVVEYHLSPMLQQYIYNIYIYGYWVYNIIRRYYLLR